MAEWLRRWTRDLVVWGSIPSPSVMCKSLGKALNPHRLCPPNSNGYQVERKLVLCEWLQLQKTRCILNREMRLWKSEFQYLGVNNVKSTVRTWNIWTINTYLYLFKLLNCNRRNANSKNSNISTKKCQLSVYGNIDWWCENCRTKWILIGYISLIDLLIYILLIFVVLKLHFNNQFVGDTIWYWGWFDWKYGEKLRGFRCLKVYLFCDVDWYIIIDIVIITTTTNNNKQ